MANGLNIGGHYSGAQSSIVIMLVYQGLTENGKHKIDLSNQANGIYFVEVQNKNSLKTQKLIKW